MEILRDNGNMKTEKKQTKYMEYNIGIYTAP